jgi:PAS domain S-box-containing protein
MFWPYLIYVIILAVSIGIAGALIVRLWRYRTMPGASGLMLSIVAVATWSFGYALEIMGPGLAVKVFWAKFEFIGISLVPLGIFVFGLQYSGRGKWLSLTRALALLIIPLSTIILTWTNESHALIWSSISLLPEAIAPLDLIHGAWFWVSAIFWYALLAVATLLLVQLARGTHELYRLQARIMLAGMAVPWLANVLYIFRLTPFPYLDLTPLALTLTNIALAIGFLRYRLLDVIPIAHETIFGAMGNGVVVLDLKGRIVEFNPAAGRIFQGFEGKIIGQDIRELLPQWDTLTLRDPAEITLESTEGKRVHNLRITPMLDRQKRASGQLLILTDITEQKRAQSQILLQVTALEAAGNGIVITNARGDIEWVNQAFTRLTGYCREEALGQNPRLLKSGQHADEFYSDLWETICSGKVWRGEMINRRKDGSLYHEEMTITPLAEPGGTISHFIAIKQDITERKRAEEELFKAHQQALEANRLKTQLLANVSHDLRTPLGAIMGFADMLHSGVYGPVNAEQSAVATEIVDSANQLLAFVNNLISKAQIETGKIVLHAAPFDPNELADVGRSAASLLAAKKGLALEVIVDQDLPRRIHGDLYWLRQIVSNLVNNAVKFTDQGIVAVRLFQVNADYWAIQVADSGIGIPQEAQPTIFEAFQQVDGSATRKHSGSGLGLAIVKELTVLMGGKIDLQSATGAGSTFTITLPFIEEEKK